MKKEPRFTPEQIAAVANERILAQHYLKTEVRQALALKRLGLAPDATDEQIIAGYREGLTWSREKIAEVQKQFPLPEEGTTLSQQP